MGILLISAGAGLAVGAWATPCPGWYSYLFRTTAPDCGYALVYTLTGVLIWGVGAMLLVLGELSSRRSDRRSTSKGVKQVVPIQGIDPADVYCGECGEPIQRSETVCLECGSRLRWDLPLEPSA